MRWLQLQFRRGVFRGGAATAETTFNQRARSCHWALLHAGGASFGFVADVADLVV